MTSSHTPTGNIARRAAMLAAGNRTKLRVDCQDCGREFLFHGLGPHRGSAHPGIRPLQGYIRVRLRDLSEKELNRVVDFIQDITDER